MELSVEKLESSIIKLNIIPNFIKPMLRQPYRVVVTSYLYEAYRKITHRPKTRSELHQYWMQPWDGSNLPRNYLKGEARRQFLVGLIKRYADSNARILEIGCNVGGNLNYLFLAGFKKLEGIEISENALQLLRQSYAEMARHTKLYNKPVEEVIGSFQDGRFDVVFTMAVLQHIHTDSEWVFSEMVKITRDFLITVEDERGTSWRHFPRNYKKVFESRGMKQVQEFNCSEVAGLGSNFFARIFRKV